MFFIEYPGWINGQRSLHISESHQVAMPTVMLPFFTFALGAGLDLNMVWQAGLLSLGLGVPVVIVTGIPLYLMDRATSDTGVAGVAAASTAGNLHSRTI